MAAANPMMQDSFEKARAAFFGTATKNSRATKPLTEFPKAQKDPSREDRPSKP
jgi:hypothetical protein